MQNKKFQETVFLVLSASLIASLALYAVHIPRYLEILDNSIFRNEPGLPAFTSWMLNKHKILFSGIALIPMMWFWLRLPDSKWIARTLLLTSCGVLFLAYWLWYSLVWLALGLPVWKLGSVVS